MERICPHRHEYPKRQEYVYRADPYMGGWQTMQGTPDWSTTGSVNKPSTTGQLILRTPLLTAFNNSNFKGKIYIKKMVFDYVRGGGNISFSIDSITSGGSVVNEYSEDEAGLFLPASGPVTENTMIPLEHTDISCSFLTLDLTPSASADLLISKIEITFLVKNQENLAAIAL